MVKAQLDAPSLATQPNWDYVTVETITPSPFSGMVENYYEILDAPTIIIGVKSRFSRRTWKFAGYAYQELIFTPSINSAFGSRVVTEERKYLKLGSQNLINFEDYGGSPYQLRIEFARWLPEIDLEIWKFTG